MNFELKDNLLIQNSTLKTLQLKPQIQFGHFNTQKKTSPIVREDCVFSANVVRW